MLVTPAATAYLLTRRLPRMIGLSAVFGAASSVIGLYASYYLDVVSGAAIVLTATAFFLWPSVEESARRRQDPNAWMTRRNPGSERSMTGVSTQ